VIGLSWGLRIEPGSAGRSMYLVSSYAKKQKCSSYAQYNVIGIRPCTLHRACLLDPFRSHYRYEPIQTSGPSLSWLFRLYAIRYNLENTVHTVVPPLGFKQDSFLAAPRASSAFFVARYLWASRT
jgi:hypothetical protein